MARAAKTFTEFTSARYAMTRENSWAWDTEVIVLAKLAGMRVVEVPVAWTEYRGNHTPIRRLASDVALHGMALLRLKSELRDRIAVKAPTHPAGFFGGSADIVGPQDKSGALLR